MKSTLNSFTAMETVAFTRGDCWILASKLGDLFGYTRVFLADTRHGMSASTMPWKHAMVKIGEDQFLDITGISSEKEIRTKWMLDDNWVFYEVTTKHEEKEFTSGLTPLYPDDYSLTDVITRLMAASLK